MYTLLVIAAIGDEVHIPVMLTERDSHSAYMAFVGSSSRMELFAHQSSGVLPPIGLTE